MQMQNNVETSKSNNEYIKCQNCKKDILSSKMFLHEGFCFRNNIICPKCEKIILKKDYETHINNHFLKNLNCSPVKTSLQNLNEENKNSDLLTEKQKKYYYSYIKINYPIKSKEIIKINKPIIIFATHENELKSQKEYEEYFLSNYQKATLLNTNIINDINNINNINKKKYFCQEKKTKNENNNNNIIIEGKDYKFNNYKLNNNYITSSQKSFELIEEFNKTKNDLNREPLDRESRFANITKSYSKDTYDNRKYPQIIFSEKINDYNFKGRYKLNNN